MNTSFLAVFKGEKATTQSLVEAVIQAVDCGLLAEGDKMPSSRELSAIVGASRTIVVRAFDQLIAQGYLEAAPGSSTVVASPKTSKSHSASKSRSAAFPWTEYYCETAKRLPANPDLFTTSADLEQLQYGAVPKDLLPAKEWGRLVSSGVQRQMKSELSAMKDVFGHEPLREAIAGFLRRTQGVVCQSSQIVIYSGTQSALADIANLLVIPGQAAAVENPGYVVAREQFRVHGAHVVPLPIDKDGLVTELLFALQQPLDWIYISPSGQDPTGAILSHDRRKQLLEWCSTNRTAIIEDAWDAEFHYGVDFPPPLFSGSNGVIFLYNFWRLLFPLSSIGVLVVPEDLIPLFRSSKYLNDRQFPTVEQYVLTEFIESGKLEQHRRNLWKVFRKRRQSLIFALKSSLAGDIEILTPGAGMHAIVRFNPKWSTEHVVDAAEQSALPLVSTKSYYFQDAVPNEFMVHFASVDPEDAKPIVEKFLGILAHRD